MSNSGLAFVLDRFNALLDADGAHLEVVAQERDALTLRYVGAAAGGCESCVLDPDDLEALVSEALQRQGSPLHRVTVLR
jgi:Fe-S cluster biogenesis protein NfuA